MDVGRRSWKYGYENSRVIHTVEEGTKKISHILFNGFPFKSLTRWISSTVGLAMDVDNKIASICYNGAYQYLVFPDVKLY